MSLERRIDTVTLVVIAGFVVAVVAHYVLGIYDGREYPWSTFLFLPQDQIGGADPVLGVHLFGDLYAVWVQANDGSPYFDPSLYPSNYFPFLHVVTEPFALAGYEVMLAVFLAGSVAGFAAILWRQLAIDDRVRRATVVLVLTAMSYPLLLALDRGNLEILLFFLLWGAIVLIERGRPVPAAALIGVAAAMKGAPLIFALLFVPMRAWKALLIAGAVFLVLTFASLVPFGGNVIQNYEAFRDSLAAFGAAASQSTDGLQHASSIKAMLESAAIELSFLEGVADLERPLSWLVLVALAGAAVLLRLALWQRVVLLTVAMLLWQPVSYDYRLLHVLLGLLLLLGRTAPARVPGAAVVLAALVLVPKGLPLIVDDVGSGSVLNPLLLLALAGVVLHHALRREHARIELPLPRRAAA
jgi:hypothetical protein